MCCSRTFWYFRRVHAAQQVSDKEAVSLHLTQPAVTSKVEPEVGPDHVRHRHSVQEPAGVQTRVVMLDPEPKKEHDAGEDIVRASYKVSLNKTLVVMFRSPHYLIFFKGPTLCVLILNTSVLHLSNAVRLLKSHIFQHFLVLE